jgi:hypothetical protein
MFVDAGFGFVTGQSSFVIGPLKEIVMQNELKAPLLISYLSTTAGSRSDFLFGCGHPAELV